MICAWSGGVASSERSQRRTRLNEAQTKDDRREIGGTKWKIFYNNCRQGLETGPGVLRTWGEEGSWCLCLGWKLHACRGNDSFSLTLTSVLSLCKKDYCFPPPNATKKAQRHHQQRNSLGNTLFFEANLSPWRRHRKDFRPYQMSIKLCRQVSNPVC